MTAISGDLASGTTVGTGPSIGVEPHPNWVQYATLSASNLEDDSGTPQTGCNLTVSGATAQLDTRASGSGDLFNMYTRAVRGGTSSSTLDFAFVGIPYSTYNVYFYMCENASSSSGQLIDVSDGTTTYYYETQAADNFNGGTLSRITSTSSGSPDTTGNYYLFSNLTGSSVTISLGTDSAGNAQVSMAGFQIVEVTAAGGYSPVIERYYRNLLAG